MGDTEGGGGCVWGGISDLLSATLGLGQGVGGGRSGCSIRPYSGCGWRGAGCRVQGAQTLASAIVIARSAWNESSASARSTPSWWGVWRGGQGGGKVGGRGGVKVGGRCGVRYGVRGGVRVRQVVRV